MSLTTVNFKASFSLDSSPKKFVFTDVTDYASQSVALADITGVIKVTAPSGVVYAGGSPDIDGSVRRENTTTILIPLLASGSPEIGNYTFEYTVTDGVDIVSTSIVYNYQYVSPTGVLTATVDCLSPELTSTDSTNYLSGNTTPSNEFSIVAVDAGANTISIAGSKSGLLGVGDTFTLINSTGNDGTYTVTNSTYDGVTDVTVISVASIVDATVDGTVSTKTNTIYFPQVLGVAPLVGYTSVVSTNSFYSETQEFKVSTKSYYDFGSVTVVDTVVATNELKVDCDLRLCEVYCCISSVLNQYLSKRGVNDTLAADYLNKYIVATSHLEALRQAFECGYDQNINTLVQEIYRVTECNPDCSCSDGTPAPIQGIGSSSNTVVQSSGNGIVVASNVVGNTTTYTLSLSQALLDSITAATATSSVSNSDGTVTVVANTVGSNTDYVLSANIPAAEAPKELMAFDLEVALASVVSGTAFAYTVSNYTSQNISNLQESVVASDTTVGAPGFYVQPVTVNGFQSTPNSTYKVFVTNTNYSGGGGFRNSTQYDALGMEFFSTQVSEKSSGSFVMTFSNTAAAYLTKFHLDGVTLKFNIQIIE